MFRYIAGIISLMLWLCTGTLNAQEGAVAYLRVTAKKVLLKGSTVTIPVNDLQQGMYLVKVATATGKISAGRFIRR